MLRRSTAFDALCDKLRHSQFQRPHETYSLSCQLQNRFLIAEATKNDSMSLVEKDFNFRIFCSLQLEFRAWQDIALTYQLHPVAPSAWVYKMTPVTTIWRESRGALGETYRVHVAPTCPSCPCHYFDCGQISVSPEPVKPIGFNRLQEKPIRKPYFKLSYSITWLEEFLTLEGFRLNSAALTLSSERERRTHTSVETEPGNTINNIRTIKQMLSGRQRVTNVLSSQATVRFIMVHLTSSPRSPRTSELSLQLP